MRFLSKISKQKTGWSPRIHYALQQQTLHFPIFKTHSLSSDFERVLKVFSGSSFILLLDRFLNRKERKMRAETNKVSRLSKSRRSLFQDFLIVAAAGKAGRVFKCYFERAAGIRSVYFLSRVCVCVYFIHRHVNTFVFSTCHCLNVTVSPCQRDWLLRSRS